MVGGIGGDVMVLLSWWGYGFGGGGGGGDGGGVGVDGGGGQEIIH